MQRFLHFYFQRLIIFRQTNNLKTQSRIKYDVMQSIALSARFFAHFVKVIDAIRIFTQDKMGFLVSQRALVKQGVYTVQLYTHN